MMGQMMDRPLMISSIIDYAADYHPNAEIVSARVEGDIHRYTYREARERIAQLAHALIGLGVKPGDRVATVAWNGYRHFELYYAISGIGAVCHTINPRLFRDQLIYVVNHASDRLIFTDATFVPLLEGLREELPDGLRFVVMADRDAMPDQGLVDALCYEELLEGQATDIEWPEFDERAAASLCYTSGTTGNPKGSLFSHRSTLLHTMGMLAIDGGGISPRDRLMPVVPLFHANSWGTAYTCPLKGTSLVFPGPNMSGEGLFDLMQAEKVSSAWGVPTIWIGLLARMRELGRAPDGFKVVIIGGSAAPEPMIREFETDYGVSVVHGWGMTEMSPIGSLGVLEPKYDSGSLDERIVLKTAQGRRMYGVDLKIVDDDGNRLPHDGVAFGELLVRGHGIVSGYFEDEAAAANSFDDDGWFRTGDVARIDADGFMSVVDRTKDVVKSGGEWISSIDLENTALGHPELQECAVIGLPHPKWDERPMLIAIRVAGSTVTDADVREFLEGKIAKWWMPDDVVFVDELPHTATGKLSKLTLRQQFKDHVLSTVGE
ncbi:MAG: long-chain-fatty-acid--CoA ligase [Rhodospirillaceae bacterium]|nr:long-chain-fatty-acid--CoA ligase [Rhodospirillaceae bacterium]MBT6137782.1 long-chain-fatty-acid--CoA ligase [Rhodospirillaceae bacterium]